MQPNLARMRSPDCSNISYRGVMVLVMAFTMALVVGTVVEAVVVNRKVDGEHGNLIEINWAVARALKVLAI